MNLSSDTPQNDGWTSRLFAPPIAALQFLTLCPPLIRRMFTPQEMGRAVGYFTLVGALLGCMLAGLDWLLRHVFPTPVSTVLVMSASVAATGALHLDGFLDACDGLFGGHTPEKRLEIMRDERVGAFGLAGGVLLLLIQFTALSASLNRTAALILAPTLSRWAMALSVALAPYAREKGLGRTIKDHAGKAQIALASVLALAAVWLVGGWMGWLALGLSGAVTWLAVRFALKRLPGLTGDLYGAIAELVGTTVLLLFAISPSR